MMSGTALADLSQVCGNLHYRLELLAKTRRHTDRMLATRFNVFEYIEPDENRLSDIIADLVHPVGKHGQGDAFLREFLAVVCDSDMPADCKFAAIDRENNTSFIERRQRRMDILINLTTYGIAIENKPWAGEQPLQIHDYVAHLSRAFAGKFVLVYLSRHGARPASIDQQEADALICDGRLVLCAYHGRFLDWLTRCHQICVADRVRSFLSDLITYTKQIFPVEVWQPTEHQE